jgi:hypothetical protein
MKNQPGVNNSKAPGLCLVSECRSKAIYRNPSGRSDRGYCSKHKHLARVDGQSAAIAQGKSLDTYLNWLTAGEWVVQCAEKE